MSDKNFFTRGHLIERSFSAISVLMADRPDLSPALKEKITKDFMKEAKSNMIVNIINSGLGAGQTRQDIEDSIRKAAENFIKEVTDCNHEY